MIPKVIHYCWFGGNPLPPLAIKCIESWKKFLPDYEIKEWNESNFDVNMIPYTAEAYRLKKYAFVSDYARFYVLYQYGGLYFDTDVEVIKNMDDIIAKGPFMGCETKSTKGHPALVAPGLGIGFEKGDALCKELLHTYDNDNFSRADGSLDMTTIVKRTTDLLIRRNYKITSDIQIVDGLYIYPMDFFCPKDYATGKVTITNNTVAIHHYGASWLPWNELLELKIWRLLGLKPHRFMWHLNKVLKVR